jgi:Ca2+-binding RTX toxin-like protein
MFGGDGTDTMFGGAGDDTADGDRGDDVAFLAGGNDLFVWDPGDGSDKVESEAGFDTMLFNGSGADEAFELSANGPRLRFTRNVGNIVRTWPASSGWTSRPSAAPIR